MTALLPNLAPLLASFNVGPLVVHRVALPSQNARGGFDDAADGTFDLNPVCVHTLSGRDLEQVPEADRNRETIQIYSQVRMNVADEGTTADVVEYDCRRWRVFHVENNARQGGVYISYAVLEDAA